MKIILLSVVMILGWSSFASLKVGDKAPDFSLKSQDGVVHSLKEQQGKYVVLEWFNDGCPYVKKHYNSQNMQNIQKEIVSKGATWYSIVSSSEGKQGFLTTDKAKSLMKEKGMHSTAILLDPDGKVGKSFGASTTPHMFILDPKGLVVYQGAIDDKPSASKQSLKGAKNYVRMAFENIDAKKPIETASTSPYGCSVKYQ
ncbi:thioredoxin family protein [bacterium]|nr:thioredoxin family protein [bacterium]